MNLRDVLLTSTHKYLKTLKYQQEEKFPFFFINRITLLFIHIFLIIQVSL